jgi:lysozyme
MTSSVGRRIVRVALAVSAAGLVFLTHQEGRVYTAYPDPVLGWQVPTICDGHTGPDVHKGEVANDAMCNALRAKDAQKALNYVAKCVTRRPLTQNQVDALVSFTVNVGGPRMCRSTLVKKLNRGDIRGAADQFLRWVYSGGRKLRGLVNRRRAERQLFLAPDS